jgi:hypothetical protein
MRSVPVGDDDSHRVNTKFKGNLKISNVEGVTTLHELAQHAFKKYGHKNAMGEREYLGPHTPKVQKFGEVSWRTYDQVKEESLKFGASLRSAGLVAAPEKSTLDKLTTPCTLAIFENTCPEWMTAALGAYSQVRGSCFVVIYSFVVVVVIRFFYSIFHFLRRSSHPRVLASQLSMPPLELMPLLNPSMMGGSVRSYATRRVSKFFLGNLRICPLSWSSSTPTT